MSQRIFCFTSTISPCIRFIRWKHTDVTGRSWGLGNIRDINKADRRFTQRIVERLHRWDGMSENNWFMIYRDNYASRVVLFFSVVAPVVGFFTSENCMADVKGGRLWDAFKNLNVVRQMGIFVVLPICIFFLMTSLAWHLNAIRIHRIYINKKDQEVFAAVISRLGLFTRKIPFTKRNIRIMESAGHPLWSFVKGSIRINKRRFLLHDEGFREIQYRHQMLGRITKLPVTAAKNDKTAS